MGKTIVIDHKALYQASKNPKQWEAHESPERYILYGGAYGGGKTAWLVNEIIRLCVLYVGNRVFLGCKFLVDFRDNALKQLEKFLPPDFPNPEFPDDPKKRIPFYIHHKTERYFRLFNGSVIMYGGLGNDEEAVKAISNMPELGAFGIDQAEQITERQFLLLDGRLRLVLPGIRYKALLTANPEPGWLRDRFIENNLPDHKFIPALPRDNPFLPPGYEEKLKKNFPLEMVKRLLEGNWDVELEGNYLIPYSKIRDAINRTLEPKGDVIMGVDVARYGGDETVCILRQGDKVVHIESWAQQDTQFSAGRVARLIREYKPLITNIDSIGIGVGVFDPLKAEGFAVKEINVGEAALDKESYLNRRAEYYGLLAKRFENGTIEIPDHSKLQSQLSSLKYTYRDTKLQIESKESMRKRGVSSPDYADALMLAFIQPPVFKIKPIDTLNYDLVRSYR